MRSHEAVPGWLKTKVHRQFLRLPSNCVFKYYSELARSPNSHRNTSAKPFHIIFLMSPSPRTFAFCLLSISSNCGWLQLPGEGVATDDCKICAFGVEGAIAVAMPNGAVDAMA